MSSLPLTDVRGNAAPAASMSDPCGLPLEEGGDGLCQNPGDEERPTMGGETEQIAAYREVAYGEFMKTTEGTPEYYRALESFILLLFPECNPPTAALPEAQRPEAPPGHGV